MWWSTSGFCQQTGRVLSVMHIRDDRQRTVDLINISCIDTPQMTCALAL